MSEDGSVIGFLYMKERGKCSFRRCRNGVKFLGCVENSKIYRQCVVTGAAVVLIVVFRLISGFFSGKIRRDGGMALGVRQKGTFVANSTFPSSQSVHHSNHQNMQ